MKSLITKRRRSSTKMVIISGTWSVRTLQGFLIEGVEECAAWKVFLQFTTTSAELLNSGRVMAAYTEKSRYMRPMLTANNS